MRKHAEWTAAHVASTLEGSHDLVHTFATALKRSETIATTAPPEITALIEANGFSVAVKRMEDRWRPEHAKIPLYEKDLERSKRAYGYAAVAIELARVSEQRFRRHRGRHRDHDKIPEALIAAALTLIATVKATSEPSDETLVQLINKAERLVESAGHAARDRQEAVSARIDAARAVEKRKAVHGAIDAAADRIVPPKWMDGRGDSKLRGSADGRGNEKPEGSVDNREA